MVYRDPKLAIQQRVTQQRNDTETQAERITDDLLRLLPAELVAAFESAKQASYVPANSVDEWRTVEQGVERYRTVIGRIYRMVPGLDERNQKIRQGFCRARQPLRKDPPMVETRLNAQKIPITLAACFSSLAASCYVPFGLPKLKVIPQSPVDGALQWVGLQQDAEFGDPSFQRAFRVVPPDDPAIPRILGAEVRQRLLQLRQRSFLQTPANVPQLTISMGQACVWWTGTQHSAHAFALLRALRNTPPPLLLHKQG